MTLTGRGPVFDRFWSLRHRHRQTRPSGPGSRAYTRIPPPPPRLRHASSTRHRISNSIEAPLKAVSVPGSNDGATSTRSPPTKSIPRRARNSRSASRAVMPPASGVPVPGASAGSRLSMSKLQIGWAIADHTARLGGGEGHPWSVNSSMPSTRMPLALENPHMSGSLVVPRMPIWITRAGRAGLPRPRGEMARHGESGSRGSRRRCRNGRRCAPSRPAGAPRSRAGSAT